MTSKQKDVLILIILIILLIAINYNYLDGKLQNFLSNSETAIVERVIDGDTIEIRNKTSIRLLGINSPEKGEIYYEEAKQFLENKLLNKTVKLEFGKEKYDKYNRILAYVYVDDKNINLELIKIGLANHYFPSGKDVYYKEFKNAWMDCIEKGINLCEISKDICTDCIEIKEFDYKNQKIILYNRCYYDCDLTEWTIKDEGRKKFIFPEFISKKNKNIEIKIGKGIDNETNLFWPDEEYVWTDTGDTLFLRDTENKLVLWKSY